jgi:hypothetical protein
MPELVDEPATRNRSDDRRSAEKTRPDRDGSLALLLVEDVHEDRQRRRHDERGTDPHECTSRDELRNARCQGAGDAADEKHQQSELQCTLSSEAISDRGRREQHPCKDQRVDRNDPLKL